MTRTLPYQLENVLAASLYVIINSLFVLKYSMRVCPYPWLITLGYWLVLGGGCYIVHQILKRSQHILIWLLVVGALGLGVGVVLQYAIDPYSLQVDRWSAIHHWIALLLQGQYPYGVSTHLGGFGSPFPVWQILHLPFYALGNVALSTLVIAVLWIVVLAYTLSKRAAFIGLMGLVMAPAFWYEVSVHSDLIANLLIITTLCQWLIYKQVHLSSHTLTLGLIAGLVLSTRLVAVIPLAVLYGYEFIHLGWRKQCLFVGTTLLTAALTFLPFLLWSGSTLLFFEYSPFVLQTRQGSPLIFVIWVVLAISYVCYFRPDSSSFPISTALLLFVLVSMACIRQIYLTSLDQIFTESTFDITYFSTALPCILMSYTYHEQQPQHNPTH